MEPGLQAHDIRMRPGNFRRSALLLIPVIVMAFSPARGYAQADLASMGEVSVYGGGMFGIGTHGAAGGTTALVTPYALLMVDASYMPIGNKTLRDYKGQVSARRSVLYDFNVSTHIRVPLRLAFEPYGILGGGLLHNVYKVSDPVNSMVLSRRSDDNFGFHTGGGVRYYLRPHWGIRGEYRVTISHQTFTRLSAGIFYQFD